MKKQNREVNIFNMSLLDILCGALGAFCFMMLALFPSYIKAKSASDSGGAADAQERARAADDRAQQAQQAARQARADQSLVYFAVQWDTADDVDLGLKAPSGEIFTVKKAADPAKGEKGTVKDVNPGPGRESVWFSDVAYQNSVWELYAELHSRAANSPTAIGAPSLPLPTAATGPVLARGYIVGRSFDKDGEAIMGFYDLPSVALTTLRQRVLVGRLTFDAEGHSFAIQGPSAGSGPPRSP